MFNLESKNVYAPLAPCPIITGGVNYCYATWVNRLTVKRRFSDLLEVCFDVQQAHRYLNQKWTRATISTMTRMAQIQNVADTLADFLTVPYFFR